MPGLLVRIALFLAAILIAAGCGRVMTPAELARHESRAFPGRSKDQVFRATIVALRSEGYEIVSADPGEGRVKTAPKVIGAQAAGGKYTAVATSTSFAWTVDVRSDAAGAAMHAEPRGYSGAQLVPADAMNADWLEKAFAQLYREIDENLPRR